MALVAVAVEFAAIAIHVAVFAPEFAALVAGRGVVAAGEIAAEVAAIMGGLCFVAADIATAAVPGKSRRHAYSHQQQNSSNCAFHILLRSPFSGSKNGNTKEASELRRFPAR